LVEVVGQVSIGDADDVWCEVRCSLRGLGVAAGELAARKKQRYRDVNSSALR
jgi:hypothetical protein